MGRLLPLALLLAACTFDPRGVPSDGAPTSGDARPDAGGPSDGQGPDATAPDGAPPDAASATCPQGYVAAEGLGVYRFDTGNTDWATARDDCANDLPGFTHLVIIGSDAENGHVDAIAGNRDVWIGVTDADDEDVWLDVLGAPQLYDNWGAFEPNNGGITGGEEDCVELLDGGAAWNDRSCGDHRRYVCECDATP
jgi:hypothetical protein